MFSNGDVQWSGNRKARRAKQAQAKALGKRSEKLIEVLKAKSSGDGPSQVNSLGHTKKHTKQKAGKK
jgi:hypothetical protein